MAKNEDPQAGKEPAREQSPQPIPEQAAPYTGEPSPDARQRVAGRLYLRAADVAVCWQLCTPGACRCICECSSICNCNCNPPSTDCGGDCGGGDCGGGDCEVELLRDDTRTPGGFCACICDCSAGDTKVDLQRSLVAIEAEFAALAGQGVTIGSRLVAIVDRLIAMESRSQTRFGDIEAILKGISERLDRTGK